MSASDNPTADIPSDDQGDGDPRAKKPQGETPTLKGNLGGPGHGHLAPDEQQIGPYRILHKLGEGGFGIVYLAEQQQPVRRRVAIKIIKLGMDTVQVVARFEQERQALAVMDHPNIARVIDGGATERGRPYFVMEHVAGEPITDYCDRHQLSVIDRLRLFLPVCEAVQHAHNKGVIHRDIKPSNVLVTVSESGPVPKVIDFGVAKAINSRMSEKTIFTEHGQIIGTPEYMSPEQAEMGLLDIDTRSDVYSLGVMLYELLTGLLPFDPHSLRSAGYAEIQRIIREVDPPRPSTRLSAAGESGAIIARNRHMQIDALEKDLRRELEWIPLMAMRKDRTQRYRTPTDLADDIRNYLDGKPLRAGPESAVYRARKFVRRNRGKVAAAAAIAMVMIAATIISAYFARRENIARKSETFALEGEKQQRQFAVMVNDFLIQGMLQSPDPEVDGADVKVMTILDRAADSLSGQVTLPPQVEASVRRSLGKSYQSIGKPESARPQFERAKALSQHLVASEPDIDSTLDINIAETYWRQGLAPEGIVILEPLLARVKASNGADDPLTLDVLNQLGGAYKRGGMLDEADRAYQDAYAGSVTRFGPKHESTLLTQYNLALVRIMRGQQLANDGQSQQANSMWEDALLDMRRVHQASVDALGATKPQTIWAQTEIATTLIRLGKKDEARQACADVLPLMRERFGPESFRTLETLANYAFLCRSMEKHEEAVIALEEAVPGYRKVRGPAYGDTTVVASWLAASYETLQRYPEEIALLKRTYDDLVAANAPIEQQQLWAGYIRRFHERRGDDAAAREWNELAGTPIAPASQPFSTN